MSPRYRLTVFAEFAAAHILRDYPGECSRLHGHNWKIEVEIEARALNEVGMGVDFKVIKQATRTLAAELDHRHLNDIPPFDKINPTAENIAAWFYRRLGQTLNTENVRVAAITIWETATAGVKYSEVED
ncbi:MAG: 6-carboxytetrahydropterin synthase QueD [Chromatiales bacterium]|jgi:6-pyruvoyltetrahydropterin/6-carboxytetrahydropterin synthase|nr:6-carboxytetrahydropterin synthase QueD [Chromatiales bacterium]